MSPSDRTALRLLLLVAIATVTAISASAQPLFIENTGQWDSQARYLLRGSGLDLWITDHGVVYDISSNDSMRSVVRLEFVDADPSALAHGAERAPGHHNYYIGNDHSRWASNVPLYREARIEELYDGIDARFYIDAGRARYDIVVAPGADASRVAMKLEGAERVRVESDGSLVIETASGEIRQRELFAYQMRDGRREQVRCGFAVDGSMVRFDVGAYDRTRKLVIDPVTMVYSTFIGGSGRDYGIGVDVDAQGNAYVATQTNSADYPTEPSGRSGFSGVIDVCMTKIDPNGSLLYSTYVGGDDIDEPNGMAIDASGTAIVTGRTSSRNFPVEEAAMKSYAGGSNDAFVTKLTTAGTLAYSTFLGGHDWDEGSSVAIDASGNAYVAGATVSADFPAVGDITSTFTGTAREVFVVKITPTGVIHSSFYFGGSGSDIAIGIDVGNEGAICLLGQTESTDFPLLHAMQSVYGGGENDLFVMMIASTGQRVYSTYLGGEAEERGGGVALDRKGNAHVVGSTASRAFPLANAIQSAHAGGRHDDDGVVATLDPNGALSYSSYLGGSSSDYLRAIEVDANATAYIVGRSSSEDFPMGNTTQSGKDRNNGFITTMSSDGRILSSTFIGGKYADEFRDIALGDGDVAYITGHTDSPDFPTVRAAQPALGGQEDAFVLKLSLLSGTVENLLSPIATTTARIDAITPNPARDDIRIDYNLSKASVVSIDIYASDGGCVMSRDLGAVRGRGDHQEIMSVAGLASGVYTLRVTAGGHSKTRRLVVVR